MKRTALVGGKGFVGQALFNQQSLRGHDYLLFDTRKPRKDVPSFLRETQAIIWCASRTNPLLASSDSALVQLEFSEWETFVNQLQVNEYEGKVVFLSSGGCVYSHGTLPFREIDEACGINEYGRLKLRMEAHLRASRLDYRILRISNLYGPGQQAGKGQGVIAEWINQIAKDNAIKVIGSKQNERDFLHIADLVTAIERVITSLSPQGIYNVGSGRKTSLDSIIRLLQTYSKTKFEIFESPARSFDRSGYSLDIEKFTSIFSWSPEIDIKNGLRQMISPGKSSA